MKALALTLALAVSSIVGCSQPVADESDSSSDALRTKTAPSAAERAAIISAIHDTIDPELNGQPNAYVIAKDASGKELMKFGKSRDGFQYVFVRGRIVKSSSDLRDFDSWTGTEYEDDDARDAMDGSHFEALLEKTEAGTWKVVEHAVGLPDVWWGDLDESYALPSAMFAP